MKFLLDQDVYAVTARFLSGLGHDVVSVAQIGLSQADDEDLLKIAATADSVNITAPDEFPAAPARQAGTGSSL